MADPRRRNPSSRRSRSPTETPRRLNALQSPSQLTDLRDRLDRIYAPPESQAHEDGLDAHGVVLNMAPETFDREAIGTLVASGLGLTFAGERSARFLDGGCVLGRADPLQGGSTAWRPLSDLGVEIRDVAMWRPDAARSPLLRPLIDVVGEVRTQLQGSAPSRKGRERAR